MSSRKVAHFWSLLILTVLLIFSPLTAISNPGDLPQAQIYYQQGQYQQAIKILSNYQGQNIPAVHEYLAASFAQIGQNYQALSHYQKAYEIYREQENINRARLCLISLAELKIELGRPLEAIAIINKWKYPLPNSINGILGNAYLVASEYEQAISYYQKALDSDLDSAQILASYNNLGSALEKLTQKYLQFAQFSQQSEEKEKLLKQSQLTQQKAKEIRLIALKKASDNLSYEAIKAKINILKYITLAEREKYLKQISSEINLLPDNHQKIKFLISLNQLNYSNPLLLQQAKQIATEIGDNFALAVAYGELGYFYEQEKNYQEALKYTELAQLKISPFLNYNYLYRWQWQEGRIYAKINQKEQAKSAYLRSLDSINQIRAQIANAGNDAEFNFQEEVEPIYRELLHLLLENPREQELVQALEIFDKLQLSELENLFREPCFYPEINNLAQWQKEENALFLVSIILDNKFHVIASLPNQKYSHHAENITKQELNSKIKQWQRELSDIHEPNYLNRGGFFYQLIFQPFAQEIKEIEPDLIVFINDGLLRNVPMSTLYDTEEQEFLIEKYPVSLALGRNFLISQEISTDIKALAFGLSQPRPPINIPLPQVKEELKLVEAQLNAEGFIDQEFTKDNLQQYLRENQPTLLHLATHGEFTGLIENSFVQAYDQVITSKQLEQLLLLSNLNLLTLSACETSTGNSRAVLGLAGIAVRTGIPSVVGTLWSIDDDLSVTIIDDFYHNWQTGMSKAQALQFAKIKQIKDQNHPLNWSAFVLIGH